MTAMTMHDHRGEAMMTSRRWMLAARLLRRCSLSRRAAGTAETDGGTGPPPGSSFQVLAGGDNVPERVQLRSLGARRVGLHRHLGRRARGTAHAGDVVKIWSLDAAGAPTPGRLDRWCPASAR